MEIRNILIEPNYKAQEFMVLGYRSTGKGVLVHLDFNGLSERECQGETTPGTPNRYLACFCS